MSNSFRSASGMIVGNSELVFANLESVKAEFFQLLKIVHEF